MSTNLKDYLRHTVLPALRQRGLYFNVAAVRACLDAARIPWQAGTINRYMPAMVRDMLGARASIIYTIARK